jgi:hypothetical protein
LYIEGHHETHEVGEERKDHVSVFFSFVNLALCAGREKEQAAGPV